VQCAITFGISDVPNFWRLELRFAPSPERSTINHQHERLHAVATAIHYVELTLHFSWNSKMISLRETGILYDQLAHRNGIYLVSAGTRRGIHEFNTRHECTTSI
jgi:hypothetical protein